MGLFYPMCLLASVGAAAVYAASRIVIRGAHACTCIHVYIQYILYIILIPRVDSYMHGCTLHLHCSLPACLPPCLRCCYCSESVLVVRDLGVQLERWYLAGQLDSVVSERVSDALILYYITCI